MAKREITWQGTVASFTMTISGGDHPKDFLVEIATELDCGSDLATLREYAAGGQSARVVMQGVLRKFKADELRALATKTLKVHINDIKDADAYRSKEMLQAKKDAALKATLESASPEMLRKMAEMLAEIQAKQAS